MAPRLWTSAAVAFVNLRWQFFVVLFVAAAGCVTRAPLPPGISPKSVATPVSSSSSVIQLERDLTNLFTDPSAGHTVWGVQIRSSHRDETLYSLNSRTLLMPASALKVVTLAAAVDRLGWDFRFETQLLADRPVQNGMLMGDLFVRGSGDPTIGTRSSKPGLYNEEDVFAEWAMELKLAGIHRISGRIVGDDGAVDWPGNGLGAGWSWDDLAFGFATPGGALQFNANIAEIVIEPAEATTMLASVRIEQAASGLDVVNHVVTGAPDSEFTLHLRRLQGESSLELRGSIPIGIEAVRRAVSVNNPTQFFVESLRRTLIREGIEVVGDAFDIDNLTSVAPIHQSGMTRVLVRHLSPVLSEFAVEMMKRSQNLFAETLFRSLVPGSASDSVAANRTSVGELLTSWSVAADQFIIADGSGLSRYNYLTASALVQVLEHVRSDPRSATLFEATLPIAGRDGTLQTRMSGTAAAGNARAKTGSMSNVSALSGFVNTRDGESLVFAILANNYQTGSDEIVRIIDSAVERLANFKR